MVSKRRVARPGSPRAAFGSALALLGFSWDYSGMQRYSTRRLSCSQQPFWLSVFCPNAHWGLPRCASSLHMRWRATAALIGLTLNVAVSFRPAIENEARLRAAANLSGLSLPISVRGQRSSAHRRAQSRLPTEIPRDSSCLTEKTRLHDTCATHGSFSDAASDLGEHRLEPARTRVVISNNLYGF